MGRSQGNWLRLHGLMRRGMNCLCGLFEAMWDLGWVLSGLVVCDSKSSSLWLVHCSFVSFKKKTWFTHSLIYVKIYNIFFILLSLKPYCYPGTDTVRIRRPLTDCRLKTWIDWYSALLALQPTSAKRNLTLKCGDLNAWLCFPNYGEIYVGTRIEHFSSYQPVHRNPCWWSLLLIEMNEIHCVRYKVLGKHYCVLSGYIFTWHTPN